MIYRIYRKLSNIQGFRDPYLAYRRFEEGYRDTLANGITDPAFKKVFIESFHIMSREEFEKYFDDLSMRERKVFSRRWHRGFDIWFQRQKRQTKR